MAYDTSSKALNPNTPEFSLARIPSPRTNSGELSMSVSRSHSFSKPAPTQPHGNAKNNGFSFPYTYQGTTYYTRPPSPPPLPHDGWVSFHPMYYTMDNGYSVAQSHGYSHHHVNGYSNQYHSGYTIPHYNNNLHQHFYNYNCSNNFPLHTPYTNGNSIYDPSAPFTNQISQVHGIRSGFIGQQNTPTRQDSLIGDSGQVGNSEWKKKKKNKRNKRKKYGKSKGKKNDEPANCEEEANGSEGVSEEMNRNQGHQNGELEAYIDGKQVHDNGDVDGQAVSDDDVDGQVNPGVSVHQDEHVDTQVRSNIKADLSSLLDGDLFYEYGESNDEVHDLNNGNSEPPRRH